MIDPTPRACWDISSTCARKWRIPHIFSACLHVPAFAGLSCDQCGRSFHFSGELRWAHITLTYVLVLYVCIYIYALKSGTRRQVILQSEPGQADITSRPSKTWRLINVCVYKRGILGLFFHCFPAGFYMNRPLSVVLRYPRTKQKNLKSRKAATSRWVCIGPRQFYLGCSTDYSLGRR